MIQAPAPMPTKKTDTTMVDPSVSLPPRILLSECCQSTSLVRPEKPEQNKAEPTSKADQNRPPFQIVRLDGPRSRSSGFMKAVVRRESEFS